MTSSLDSVATHKIRTRFFLVDTKPDFNIEWSESYQCDTWKEAYGKMVQIMLEISPDNIESNLVNANAVIKPYAAQTFDTEGIRHVFHIICV